MVVNSPASAVEASLSCLSSAELSSTVEDWLAEESPGSEAELLLLPLQPAKAAVITIRAAKRVANFFMGDSLLRPFLFSL